MKELEGIPQLQPETTIEVQKQMEYTLRGSMIHRNGLKLFSFNVNTHWLQEEKVEWNAQMTSGTPQIAHRFGIIDLVFRGKPHHSEIKKFGRVNMKPGCVYFEALNLDVAERKIRKMYKKYSQ